MEEQMRLYIRLAMEDSGFHLHTSMDNNMYNLINVTRFPSFDTSARMRSSIFNLHFCSYESSVLQALHGRPEVLEICGVGLTASCSTRVSRTGCREEEARSRSFDPAGRGREREATEVEVRSNLGPPEVCELEGGKASDGLWVSPGSRDRGGGRRKPRLLQTPRETNKMKRPGKP
ncbi:hypothetical protein M5K25_017148 [Dendrobium thyrsiflorum]|uniref:Uncharacterized protein n=1 Tax=Dendrobium thyrsiflorum TaxID=117978 RepID=A0ABD0UTF7_DENTH